MNHEIYKLPPALYLVATPLGSARDITLRALDVLASADVLAAEDTRTLRKLLSIHGLSLGARKIIAFHDHSSTSQADGVLKLVNDGQSVAYVSEAGTPGISDPGYELVQAALRIDATVNAVPGPVAAISGLIVSGLPTDRFRFYGFPPPQEAKRTVLLAELKSNTETTIFYESPKRVHSLLTDIVNILGGEQPVVIARELTKRYEEVLRGTAANLLETVTQTPLRGEIVVMLGPTAAKNQDEETVRRALLEAMATMRVKDAATVVAGALGLPKREVYQRALELKTNGGTKAL